MVSNDTGPLHLAAAVGTPTVGDLLGRQPDQRGDAAARPAPADRLLDAHCPVCGVDCTPGIYPHRPGDGDCPHRDSFVTDVPVAEVLEAARDLLDLP